jgi:CrcB protein
MVYHVFRLTATASVDYASTPRKSNSPAAWYNQAIRGDGVRLQPSQLWGTDDSWLLSCARSFFIIGHRGRAESDGDLRILLLIVFGSAGTLARYALQGLVQFRTGWSFPAGTLLVNLLGCFLLGGIGQYGLDHLAFPPDWRVAVTVGFFGAFTTFSSFSWETVHLFEDGEWMPACAYVAVSLLGGLVLVRTGMRLAKWF